MPEFYYFATGASVAAADVVAEARAGLAGLRSAWAEGLDPGGLAIDSPPATIGREELLATLPAEARAATSRYWDRWAAELAERAAEMLPVAVDGEPIQFECLSAQWRGHPTRTLVGVRHRAPVGLLAVFPGWTVDAVGRIESPPPRAAAASSHAAQVRVGDFGQSVFSNVSPLIEYVAQGLVDGFPVLGKLLKMVVGVISDAAKSAMDGGTKQLDAFAQELKASDAQLETDLASAGIMTYQFWAANHYQDQWLVDVSQGDANSPGVQATRKTLAGFVQSVSDDFDDRNAKVLTAVNLMMTERPAPNPNLEYPTLAMLKSGGFFFLANYVLTLGRQAFNAQLALTDPTTAAALGTQLARLSRVYTDYATALKSAVDQQYAQRTAYLRLSIDRAHCFIDVIDDWDSNPAKRPAGMRVWTANYCGSDEYGRRLAEGQADLQRRQDGYRRSFWAGDPTARGQAVEQMQSNDRLLQALSKSP